MFILKKSFYILEFEQPPIAAVTHGRHKLVRLPQTGLSKAEGRRTAAVSFTARWNDDCVDTNFPDYR